MASGLPYLDSTRSDEALETAAWRKEVQHAKKLFEISAQMPSPSKDFAQVLLTERGVVWRRWKITLRGVAQGGVPSPTEQVMTHDDFGYDSTLQGEVERVFGPEVLRQMKRILSGSRDELSKLPENVTVKIVSYLDLQSITRLSQVNSHLREVCNSDKLWQQLYLTHQGTPSDDVTALAKDIGWKRIFFMSKLQLQKELSRQRRLRPSHGNGRDHGGEASKSPSSTFLTQSF